MNQQYIIIQTRNANLGQQEGPPSSCPRPPPLSLALLLNSMDLFTISSSCGLSVTWGSRRMRRGGERGESESANYWTYIVEPQTLVYMTFHDLPADLVEYFHVPVLEQVYHVELFVLQEHGHRDLGRHNIGRHDFGHFPPSRLLFLLFLVRRQQLFLYCTHPDCKWPAIWNKYWNTDSANSTRYNWRLARSTLKPPGGQGLTSIWVFSCQGPSGHWYEQLKP